MKKFRKIDVNDIRHEINKLPANKDDLLLVGYFNYNAYKFVINQHVINDKYVVDYKIPLKLSYKQIMVLHKADTSLKKLLSPIVISIVSIIKNYTIHMLISNNYIYLNDVINNCFDKDISSKDINKIKYKLIKDFDINVNNTFIKKQYKYYIVVHYYYRGNLKKEKVLNIYRIPIWIIFNMISLGHFGDLLSNFSKDTREEILSPMNVVGHKYDYDFIRHILLLKDLRNALAHNKIVFDCRFKNKRVINHYMITRLENKVHINNINFNSIIDYFILMLYYQYQLQVNKNSIRREIYEFIKIMQNITLNVKRKTFTKILGKYGINKLKDLYKFEI